METVAPTYTIRLRPNGTEMLRSNQLAILGDKIKVVEGKALVTGGLSVEDEKILFALKATSHVLRTKPLSEFIIHNIPLNPSDKSLTLPEKAALALGFKASKTRFIESILPLS